jgi:hypothetical protein
MSAFDPKWTWHGAGPSRIRKSASFDEGEAEAVAGTLYSAAGRAREVLGQYQTAGVGMLFD